MHVSIARNQASPAGDHVGTIVTGCVIFIIGIRIAQNGDSGEQLPGCNEQSPVVRNQIRGTPRAKLNPRAGA